jgi:phosphohistidine phosphatase
MRKTLILIRHSNAESRDQSSGDINRPLTEEGRADSYKMANLILRSGIKPDLILASLAARASQTAIIFAEVLRTEAGCIKISRKFYYCPAQTIADNVSGLPDNIKCVIVVAHNPGISELARILSSGRVLYMDNTHVIILEFDIDHWHQFADRKPILFQSHRVIDIPEN